MRSPAKIPAMDTIVNGNRPGSRLIKDVRRTTKKLVLDDVVDPKDSLPDVKKERKKIGRRSMVRRGQCILSKAIGK